MVCHGYHSQRADVLTLVTALQDQQFNVFLFDFTAHGTSPGVTTLGYRETAELQAAMQALATRDDVDPKHFGLWGVDMGGYVVLEDAVSDPRICAFIVDDAYADPRDMVQIEMKRSGLTVLPYVSKFCDIGFRIVNYQFRDEPPVTPTAHADQGHSEAVLRVGRSSRAGGGDDEPLLAFAGPEADGSRSGELFGYVRRRPQELRKPGGEFLSAEFAADIPLGKSLARSGFDGHVEYPPGGGSSRVAVKSSSLHDFFESSSGGKHQGRVGILR